MKQAAAVLSCSLLAVAASAQDSEQGRKEFAALCASCHGSDGAGGERGPGILDAPGRGRSLEGLRDVIRNGVPEGGMPGFALPAAELDRLAAYVNRLRSPAGDRPTPGSPEAGARFFFGKGGCSTCHMVNGRGGILGPDLSNLGRERRLAQIERALRNPGASPARGYRGAVLRLRDGRTVRGVIRNESNYDVQLQDAEGGLHGYTREELAEETRDPKSLMPAVNATGEDMRDLLAFLTRLGGASRVRLPLPNQPERQGGLSFSQIANPTPGEWPTYNGTPGGNRYSPLRQIDRENVARLAVKWIFPVPTRKLETTPVVVDGVMYITTGNQAWALDARSGRQMWHYSRPLTKGVIGDASGGINRGVGVLGDRVFMVTDHAHLLALHRAGGQLLWDTEMADYRQHYGATSAPLVVNDLVLSGTSGGDEGARGFVAAFKASTGERVWRFWTMPAPGEPLSETWAGRAIEHGCVAAWLTGTYDPETDLVYWPTGNPCPDYNGDERKGDNLYANSVVALESKTGKLRWHYQFTPHDLHDWDAAETPVLVDGVFQGRPRKLLLQANRNGFFYVLDRGTGEFLMAQPFVRKLTWASGIGADGRPQIIPGAEPSVQGTRACPSVEGATNWMSPSYHPSTGLFYVMALEMCSIYSKSSAWWEPGKSFYGGGTRRVPGETPEKLLRAIELQTGKIAWEVPQIGSGDVTWGGLLSTAGGLVFFCDDSGAFAAVDARDGKPLWHLHTNQFWHASPMTYLADGKQYVAVAAGSNVIAFGLP